MTLRIVVLALAACVIATAPASADSIVYEKDGNIWQAEPDGSRQTPVTTSGGYAKPTQADDGTIIAVKDGILQRMDRAGRVLNTAGERGAGSGAGPITPHLAPNGGLVAYNYFYLGSFRYALSHASRETAHEEIHTISGWSNPTWIGNDRVLLFDGSEPFASGTLLYRVGDPGTTTWFDGGGLNLVGGEIDASQTRFAATTGSVIRLYRLHAPPPAVAVEARCDLTGPAGSFFRPSWSPDGGSLAWQEDDGIWVGRIDLDTCPNDARVVIPGAKAPDWGPADVSTPASTGAPGGGGGPAGGGGTGTVAAPVLTTTVPKRVRRRSLLRGLRVRAGCDRPCRVTADLRVDRRTAKRLGLGRRIGRKRVSTSAAGKVTLRLRPTTKARRRLRGRPLRKVSVVVRAVDAAGLASAPVTQTVTVRG